MLTRLENRAVVSAIASARDQTSVLEPLRNGSRRRSLEVFSDPRDGASNDTPHASVEVTKLTSEGVLKRHEPAPASAGSVVLKDEDSVLSGSRSLHLLGQPKD